MFNANCVSIRYGDLKTICEYKKKNDPQIICDVHNVDALGLRVYRSDLINQLHHHD